jgi:hypothetical protein
MKKALVLALVFVIGLSVAASAGFYFAIENAGLLLSPELTLGVDFGVMVNTQTPPIMLTGDFYAVIPDILAAPNPETAWELGTALGVSLGYMDCDFEAYFVFNPENYPGSIEILEDTALSLILTGKPGHPVEVWGGLELTYEPNNMWLLAPVFGFEAHW